MGTSKVLYLAIVGAPSATMADEEHVKGTGEFAKQAAAGLALFAAEDEVEIDVEGATKYKEECEAKMKSLEEESKALTGKDNKKARQEKDKEKAAIKVQKEYIDACKAVKGLTPPNGHFMKKKAAAAPAQTEEKKEEEEKVEDKKADKEKKEKPKKATESAGISPAERKELEDLKNKIIEKKKALKESGMSGGQINKEEEIVAWVTRMNELKEKENPGCLEKAKEDKKKPKKKMLSTEEQAALEEKEKAFQEYEEKLRTEYKYSKKEIAADPDYKEMKAELEKLRK